MAKEKSVYVCSNCGQESPKWIGKCPGCGEWNTYVEEIIRKESGPKKVSTGMESVKTRPITLNEIEAADEPRIDMYDEELNRVLGGGLVTLMALFNSSLRKSSFQPVRLAPVSFF